MASTVKLHLFFIAFLSASSSLTIATGRPLDPKFSGLVAAGLTLDDESSNCWDSVLQLQSCTGELIMFFLNGETDLGRGCCRMIGAISQECWPTITDVLGFTPDETDVLQGYCNYESSSPSPSPLPMPLS